MDPVHESGNHKFSKDDTEANRNTRDELDPTISSMDSKHDSGTIADTKFPVNEHTVGWVEKSKSTHSVSSSSSESSLEDFFQMDDKSHPSPAFSPKPLKVDKNDIHVDTPKSEKPGNWSPGTNSSPMCNGPHESWMNGMSTTQYPPIQVMDRTSGYDPHRLPSSIFARNSSTSMGWSVASNESLFSLNFGTNSFSRDHSLMFEDLHGGEYYKSDELHESDELNWFGQPHPPPLVEENGISDDDKGEVEGKSEEKGRVSHDDQGELAAKVVRDESIHDESEVKLPTPYGSSNSNSPTANCEPGGGGTGTQPVVLSRKKKSAWRFCQCTNCRWTFCYGCKRKQKTCSSVSSEENLKNEKTRTSRKGSLEKKASPKPDTESAQEPYSKKSSSSFATCSCSFCFCC